MSESASNSTGIAGRYATAVFELAKESGDLGALERDVDTLEEAISESSDLRDLINSPIYSREEQGAAIAAIADKMGLTSVMANTLKLMASKRRLFVLPQLVKVLRDLMDEPNGVTEYDVFYSETEARDKRFAEAVGEFSGVTLHQRNDHGHMMIRGMMQTGELTGLFPALKSA